MGQHSNLITEVESLVSQASDAIEDVSFEKSFDFNIKKLEDSSNVLKEASARAEEILAIYASYQTESAKLKIPQSEQPEIEQYSDGNLEKVRKELNELNEELKHVKGEQE